MKFKQGQFMEVGDCVRATDRGVSKGKAYKAGDMGRVRSTAGSFFDVTLDDGTELGIVDLSNWEKVEESER